jgi:hypothetical protein
MSKGKPIKRGVISALFMKLSSTKKFLSLNALLFR